MIGAIVGSDIYIASAITAGLIGPLWILVWIVAGIMATILAMVFGYSSYYVPRAGGSFAFVSAAFDDFYGFLAGLIAGNLIYAFIVVRNATLLMRELVH